MGSVSRREFIAGGAAIGGSLTVRAQAEMKPGIRPNIVFILADDLGWGDLSCYGRPDYETPNLDRLAKEGMRFTNAYSASPVCTPTRVGFHTGRYPARLAVGLEEPLVARKILGDRTKSLGIPHEHPTVSSLLKASNYETALIGKWHVGYMPNFSPLKYGYDEFFGMTSGAGDRFTHRDPAGDPDLFEGDVPVERMGYLTELLTARAVDFIRRPRKEPFYLSLHHTAPHWPWQGPNDASTSASLRPGHIGFAEGGSAKKFAEIMKTLDSGIGTVLRVLKETGHERNTLVVLTSDNGGERFSYNWPFSGQKFDLREGGIRVPAIVRWPGVTRSGTVSDQPVITMDWTATLIAAAGCKPDGNYPLDGEDVRPILSGQRSANERTFLWRTKRQGAVRKGKWKYLREGSSEFLFDLSVDEREQAEFGREHPEIVKSLRRDFDAWQLEMAKYPPA